MPTTTAKMPTLTATTADPSKLQKIINNSGGDIVVSLPISSADSHSANSVVSSNGDWELLPVTKGGNTIKSADNDTVLLDRTYNDPDTGETAYSMGYDLLIGTPTWLVPIANIGVIQDYDDDDPSKTFFDDVTVTADQKTALTQTVAFLQTIAAYPDSDLANKYLAAMDNTNKDVDSVADGSSGSADAVQGKIDGGAAAFFASTKSYQKVTFADIVYVQAYYNDFPFVWAQYNDSATYYLYSSDSTTTVFEGALSLKKPATIDISQPNGGYTCSFLPAVTPGDTTKFDVDQTKAKTLTYSNGLFVDDATADLPTVALHGSFQLKRTFTKDPNDTKIIVVICGTVNGATAVGFDQAQVTKADDTTEDWLDSLFHPKTAAGIFNSVMTILGALMMLHFVGSLLYGIYKWANRQGAAKKPVDKTSLDAEREKAGTDYKSRASDRVKKMSNNKESISDTPEDALNTAVNEKGTLSDCVSAGQAEDGLVKMKNNLRALEEYVVDDYTGTMQGNINSAAGEVKANLTDLTSADIADLKSTLAELRPKMQALSEQMTKLNTDMQTIVEKQQKSFNDENIKDMEAVQEDIENEDKTYEDEANDPNADDPEADPVEFPDV
jgi:hypothetical protein